ncbi:MAG: hypothetical protein AB9834_23050 [Lentimicrobium sp.]
MKELNENSLQKAIQQLPLHKAGNYVWEEVRWQLDKPLSAELPVHAAPAGSWQGIRAASVASGKTNAFRIAAITSLILLLVSLILYPVLLNEPDQFTASEATGNQNTIPAKASGISSPADNQPGITTSSGAAEMPQNFNEVTPAEQPDEKYISTMVSTINPDENRAMKVHPLLLKKGNSIMGSNAEQQETIRWRNDPRYAECASFHEVNTAVFMVADYEPELFGDKTFDVPVHNFSVSSGYRHNRFGITLGAGFTRITGTSQLSYAYRTNELVYSYDYVDSVYVDPVTHETYYFTVKVDVYDSIDHTTEGRVTDRYSYLQIPLSITYELAGFNKLTLNLQLTGTYHLLQDDYRNYDPFHEASSRLVSTTMEDKKINSDYWSAGAGLMLAYQAGNRFGVSLTPRIKYNSLPVKGSIDKGFISYGINFGIFYKITGDP